MRMATDILGRRLRHASPQPRGRHIELTERDLVLFETLQRHGPLPSTYLFESTKHLGRNETDLKHRLTKLYNGTVKGIAYLTRPPQQFAAYDARCQPGIYDLTLCAAGALAERGRGARFIIPRADPFLHRLMTACVGASIELAAREGGVRYLTKEDIFSHRSCPASTRSASNPLAVAANGKTFVPDDLFGFAYPGPRYRFFAVEIDRSTESIERRNVAQTAYGRKLEAYLTIMRDRTYRKH